MNEVYIVTWVNEFDGDLEMYVSETREIANEFASHLGEDGIDYKVANRPVQSESIHLSEPLVADYSGEMAS